MVSNSPQASFHLVSRVYHIRNCKHLPPVSSFLESVECADLLNQGTVFPEPTHIPAQQMRLGFCHGPLYQFQTHHCDANLSPFSFLWEMWKLVQHGDLTVANMGQRELNTSVDTIHIFTIKSVKV